MPLDVPNSPISPYRFNVETYTIGGPVFIPKVFNRQKKRLFFFWSQEYTGQFVSGGIQNKYTPTALERRAISRRASQNNGALITITDPTTGAPFPGNIIPTNRIDPMGQAMLNFFPLPNFVGTGIAGEHRELLRSGQRHPSAAQRRAARGHLHHVAR